MLPYIWFLIALSEYIFAALGAEVKNRMKKEYE